MPPQAELFLILLAFFSLSYITYRYLLLPFISPIVNFVIRLSSGFYFRPHVLVSGATYNITYRSVRDRAFWIITNKIVSISVIIGLLFLLFARTDWHTYYTIQPYSLSAGDKVITVDGVEATVIGEDDEEYCYNIEYANGKTETMHIIYITGRKIEKKLNVLSYMGVLVRSMAGAIARVPIYYETLMDNW